MAGYVLEIILVLPVLLLTRPDQCWIANACCSEESREASLLQNLIFPRARITLLQRLIHSISSIVNGHRMVKFWVVNSPKKDRKATTRQYIDSLQPDI